MRPEFDIYLTGEVVPESDGDAVYGRIHIQDYSETFVASLACWSPTQYEQHWREACQRLISGARESALISSYVEPPMSEFLTWWPLYREGEIIYVRNEILVYSQLSHPFSVESPWSAIRKRQILSDEGLEISEWTMGIRSIREYLDRKRRAA
jgi:hypothetical protein